MNIRHCAIFFSFILLFPYSQLGAQIHVRIGNKKYLVPAFENETPGYISRIEKAGVLTPLSSSDYDIEIRARFVSYNVLNEQTVVIKGNKGVLTAEAWLYKEPWNDKQVPSWFNVAKTGGSYGVKAVMISDSLFISMIKDGLFRLVDIRAIEDSLRRIKLGIYRPWLDGYSMAFEIKVGNNCRYLNVDPMAYAFNKNIKELLPGKVLAEKMTTLFKSSGLRLELSP